jgi:hypothetical protein
MWEVLAGLGAALLFFSVGAVIGGLYVFNTFGKWLDNNGCYLCKERWDNK